MTSEADCLRRLDQAAERLGCGVTTVRGLIRTGELRAVRVAGALRVPDSAIDEFIANLAAIRER
jgi:excisionase family DNA binding protein